MAEDYSKTSLDYWRKFFSCANADIFQVIKYAILVASADCPNEFLSWRDHITEILYTSWSVQCCSSDRAELRTPEGGVEDDGTSEDTEKHSKESKSSSSEENEPAASNEQSTSNTPDSANLDEFEALTDEIEEEQLTVREVLRIKGVLANWREESEKVLSESLRRLQLMELSVETLGATDISGAVRGLYKHKSRPIQQLAQTLVKGWKLLTEEWVTAAAVSQEPSPMLHDPSPVEEESLLPSELDFPPLDMGALLATQTASFEFSKFFEEMDDDGNITSSKDLKKNGRKPQLNNGHSARKNDEDVRRQEASNKQKVSRHSLSTEATHKAPKPMDISAPRVPEKPSAKATACRTIQPRLKVQSHSGEVKRQEVVNRVSKPVDATAKSSRPRQIPSTQVSGRSSVRAATSKNTEQRLKSSLVQSRTMTSRRDVSNVSEESAYRDRLEVAKRKLQDRYQEVNDAKRQRKIQVMELEELPKQNQSNQQINMKRGSFFKRRVNMKSK